MTIDVAAGAIARKFGPVTRLEAAAALDALLDGVTGVDKHEAKMLLFRFIKASREQEKVEALISAATLMYELADEPSSGSRFHSNAAEFLKADEACRAALANVQPASTQGES